MERPLAFVRRLGPADGSDIVRGGGVLTLARVHLSKASQHVTESSLPAPPEAAKPDPTRSFLVSFPLGHLANDFAPGSVWLLTPAIAIAMNLTPAEIGLLIGIHSVGASLGYLPAGILADHVANRGRLLAATFWWVGIGYIIASFAPEFWTLALLMAAAGLGDAAWHPIATGVLVQARPKRRAQALGIHAMGGTFAEVLAPLAVGFLLVHLDWRTTLQIAALPALLMGLYFLFLLPRVPPSPDGAMSRADFGALLRAWRSKTGFKIAGQIIFYNLALMAIMSMTPLYLQTAKSFTSVAAGAVFSGMILAGALVQPLVGYLSDRVGRKAIIVIGNLVGAGGAVGLALVDGALAIVGLLIVAVGALTSIRAAVLASAVDFARKREGTTLGLTFVLLDGVGAVGSILAGAVGSLDLTYAFVLAAAFSLVAVLVAVMTPVTARDG